MKKNLLALSLSLGGVLLCAGGAADADRAHDLSDDASLGPTHACVGHGPVCIPGHVRVVELPGERRPSR